MEASVGAAADGLSIASPAAHDVKALKAGVLTAEAEAAETLPVSSAE